MEISKEEYESLLKRLDALENPKKEDLRTLKSMKTYINTDLMQILADSYDWQCLQGLCHGIHYHFIENKGFCCHNTKISGKRNSRHLTIEDVKLSAKMAEEILKIYKKYADLARCV